MLQISKWITLAVRKSPIAARRGEKRKARKEAEKRNQDKTALLSMQEKAGSQEET
jgi:hypothetical protein